MDRLDEQVFLAIGRAMVCTDEEKAYEIGKQLVAGIREYIQEHTQPQPPTYVPYPVYPCNPPIIPYQWFCGTEQIKITLDANTVCNPTICNPRGY
jgi:hypothetical protein